MWWNKTRIKDNRLERSAESLGNAKSLSPSWEYLLQRKHSVLLGLKSVREMLSNVCRLDFLVSLIRLLSRSCYIPSKLAAAVVVARFYFALLVGHKQYGARQIATRVWHNLKVFWAKWKKFNIIYK